VPSEKTKGREERGKRALYRHRLSWKRQRIKGIKEGRERLLRAGETVTGVVNGWRKKNLTSWAHLSARGKRGGSTVSGRRASWATGRFLFWAETVPSGPVHIFPSFSSFSFPEFLFLF
jgi:hypothetical protein